GKALTERRDGPRRLIARGIAWGLGHTLALFFICATVIVLGLTISSRLEAGLEMVVGLMIAGLGLRVLWRLRRDRVHVHVHEHDGQRHIHAHSHKGETVPHGAAPHGHAHRPLRDNLGTLGVGLVHGAAGSAGLLVLTVAATDSLAQALAYCAVFGVGSLAGMATLSAAASLPLGLVQHGAGWVRPAVMAGIGGLAIWVGGSLALSSLGGLELARL
ncbi:hypothetical protein LCGC14_1419790, partial [marine sediment metagenome]